MKTKLFTLLIIAITIQSCKKKDEPAPAASVSISGCVVQNVKMAGQDFITYTYDNSNKISSFITVEPSTGVISTNQVTYSGSTMTTKEYNGNNTLINTTIAVLNSDDNLSSSISTGIDTSYNNGTKVARNVYDTASYQYDADKFLIKEIHKTRTVEIISGNVAFKKDSIGYIIQNENIVSANEKFIYLNLNSQDISTTFTYGTDLNKSVQMVDAWGVAFIPNSHRGKTSKYLVQTETSSGTYTDTFSFTYTFDSNGYMTEQTGSGSFPISYTYLCH